MDVEIDGRTLNIFKVRVVAENRAKVRIPGHTRDSLGASRHRFMNLISLGLRVYGVNTGFGSLLNDTVSASDASELQANLLRSHSSGVGNPLSPEHVRSIMLVRANSLAVGYSAVDPALLDLTCEMINRGLTPYVPSLGSVGASGDLAPLAHIGLAMMGEGEFILDGKRVRSSEVLRSVGLEPYRFGAKEAVAFINGTSCITGILAYELSRAYELMQAAVVSSIMSLDALGATRKAFTPWAVASRPHPGQVMIGEAIYSATEDSEIMNSSQRVQDAYTLRCIPQVYGATLDAMDYVRSVVEREMNSATDNPLFNGSEVISSGNFHGQPVALACDFLSIALTSMGSMVERRVSRMVDSNLSGLPPFLVEKHGLNSGYMIPQYVAAALTNMNMVLSHPSSTGSIPTSANQEDHVSMGMNGAIKLSQIVDNLGNILAIELLLAAQALEFSRGKPSSLTDKAYRLIRNEIPPLDSDRPPYLDIEKLRSLLPSIAEISPVKFGQT